MPAENCQDVFFSWLGSFFGILVVALLHFLVLDKDDMLFLVAGFGASSVTPHFHTLALVLTATKTLLYAAPKAPMAQPWNVIGGNTVSAFAGVTCRYIINQFICNGRCQYLGCAFAVSLGESFDRISCRAHKHLCFHSFSKLLPFTTPCSNPLFHPYLCIAIVGMKVTRSVHPPGGAMVQNLQTLTFRASSTISLTPPSQILIASVGFDRHYRLGEYFKVGLYLLCDTCFYWFVRVSVSCVCYQQPLFPASIPAILVVT